MSIIPSLAADVRGGCPTPSARRRSGVVRISGRDQVRVFGTHSAWACRLLITGLESEFDRRIFGIDSIQALELALVLAGKRRATIDWGLIRTHSPDRKTQHSPGTIHLHAAHQSTISRSMLGSRGSPAWPGCPVAAASRTAAGIRG